MKRFAIYARFSSDRQNEASIEDQERVCCTYVERIGGVVIEVYADRAVSGSHTVERPQYRRMLDDAAAGKFDAIVAEDQDRYTRDLEHSAWLQKRMAFLCMEIHTANGGRVSKLEGAFKGVMNDIFLDNLRDKTRRGMFGAFQRGKIPGGLSFGYKAGTAPGQRVVDETQAPIVRLIFDLYAAGISPRAIVTRLNADGIRTPRGRRWRVSTLIGNPKRLNGILNNPIYIGRPVFGRQTFVKNPDTGKRQARPNSRHEWQQQELPALRIISDELWETAQIRRRKLSWKKPHNARRPKTLLSGLIKCADSRGSGHRNASA
jgi:DNA invertase Pin-like site-specific DNA recombinase